MFRCVLCVYCILLFLITTPVNGKWADGELNTLEDWKFITRFCFMSSKGTLRYYFEYPVNYGVLKILLYYDSVEQWSSVYKSTKNCTQREDVIDPHNNAIIPLDTTNGCVKKTVSGNEKFVCSGERVFQQARERWWYIAASHCRPKSAEPIGLSLTYKIHMTNGPEEDYLHREYSADEFYIQPINTAFLIAYVILCTLTVICAVYLRNRQLWHTTYKMYMVSVFIWTFYLFLMSIAYGIYGKDGLEKKLLSTKYAARAFEAISIMIFLLMLILIGKGYTITRGKLSTMSTVKITVFMTLYATVYVVIFIWDAVIFDPGWVLYIYESPPGYALIAMRIKGFLWFCYAIFFTLKHYPEKGSFYYPLFVFYTLWFWAGPIVIIIAMTSIPLWTREKTVNGVENFVAFCGHVFFLILTRPSAANKNFPYHVRTTQIGILQNAPHSAEDGMLVGNDSFSSHAYAPSESSSAPDLMIMFTTEKSRSVKITEDASLSNNYLPAYTSSNGAKNRNPNQSSVEATAHLDLSDGLSLTYKDMELVPSPPPAYEMLSANPS